MVSQIIAWVFAVSTLCYSHFLLDAGMRIMFRFISTYVHQYTENFLIKKSEKLLKLLLVYIRIEDSHLIPFDFIII